MLKLKAFYKHFILPEFKLIAGKLYLNLVIVALIFLLSLLTIGLGKGVTQYLEQKMKDPFIRFVDLQIPASAAGFEWQSLNKDTLRKRFNYSAIEPVFFRFMNFRTKKGTVSGKARKIKTSSEFYKYLSSNAGVFITNPLKSTFSNKGYGVIVTQKFINDLNYNFRKTPFIKYQVKVGNNRHFIPLPIAGVVKKLPNYTDLLISKKLEKAIVNKNQVLAVDQSVHRNYLRIYTEAESEKITKLQEKGFRKVAQSDVAFGDGQILEKTGIATLSSEFEQAKNMLNDNCLRLYNLDRSFAGKFEYRPSEDFVTFPFNNLDSVYAFNEYLMNNTKSDLRLNMSTIESKENFQLFNQISRFLSFSLIVFSILVVILFVTNVILAHIERNKKNLGTLKAFGLPNISIVLVYTLIAGLMVLIAFAIAIGVSYLIGNPLLDLLTQFMELNVERGSIAFQLYSIWIILGFFILIPIIVLFNRLFKTLSNQTPGDLVFGRV